MGTPGMGEGVEGGWPRAAMAAREELGLGREGGWLWLGKVKEGLRMLTSKGMESRWLDGGDRWVVCSLRRIEDGDIEQGRSSGVERLSELGLVAELRAASPFYRRGGQRWRRARTGGKDDGRGLWQLGVKVHSGELIAEAMAALKHARRAAWPVRRLQ